MGDRPPVVALIGPTAAGKSAIALAVAEAAGAELVAVDAFTVYRGMDIGTAKPTTEDRRRVPHHMVDVLDVEQECHVRWFQSAARAAIADVHARGRAALLVGGSGLYFRAVVDPLDFPPTDPAVRARIEARHRDDPAAAHALLARTDPAAAARIDPHNLRRTVRALEVIELTGRPFSSFRTGWDGAESVYPGLQVVGIHLDRPTLTTLVRRRAEAMLAAGWLDEARALRGRRLSRSAAQAIGYAELFAHLDGQVPLDVAVEQIVTRTRRYATRQQRWFAADPRVQWVTADTAPERLLAAIRR